MWSQEQNDSIPTYFLNEVVLKPEINWLNKIAQESFNNRQVISAQDHPLIEKRSNSKELLSIGVLT